MKNLGQYINEANNTSSKSAINPRKGSTIYLLKQGETKCIPAKVEYTHKYVDRGWDKTGKSYNNYIELADNEYGVKSYNYFIIGGIDYTDRDQVITITYDEQTYYAGISVQVIKAFIDDDANKKLNGVLSNIKELEKQLEDLYKERDGLMTKINTNITESLKQ